MKNHDTTTNGLCSISTTTEDCYFLDNVRVTVGRTTATDYSPYPAYREVVDVGPLIKGDGVRPNSWSYSVVEDSYPFGSVSSFSGDQGARTWQTVSGAIGGFIPLPPWAESVEYQRVAVNNGALSKFYRSLGFGRNSVQTDLGESRATLETAEKLAKGLARPVASVAKLSHAFFSRWGALKVPANAYLAYIFGVKPLVEDIYETCKQIDAALPTIIPVRGKANATVKQNVKLDGWDTDYSTVVCAEYGGLAVVQDEHRYTLSKLGVFTPVSLAWELLPFSFLADYVCNLGQFLYLNEAAYLSGCQLVGGYRSELTIVKRTGIYTHRESIGEGGYKQGYANLKGRKVLFSRTLLDSFPRPVAPSLQVQLGSQRLVNLGSLLAQRLPSLPRNFR